MKEKIFILILVFCISCTHKKKTGSTQTDFDTEEIVIDLNKAKDINISQLMYRITPIRLSVPDEFPIGNINKLIVTDECIYILDSNKARALFVFSKFGGIDSIAFTNKSGDLITYINKIGQGPGEYSNPSDFFIENETNNIVICDGNRRKIIFYSPIGEFLREIKLDFPIIGVIQDENNNIVLDRGNFPEPNVKNYIVSINNEGKITKEWVPIYPYLMGMIMIPRNPLQKFNNNIYYLPALSNDIYVIEDGDAKIKYRINLGKDRPTIGLFEEVHTLHPKQYLESLQKKVSLINFIQTKDYLHLDFRKGENHYSYYYNKSTKKSLLFFLKNPNKNGNVITTPIATYEDRFIYVMYKADESISLGIFAINDNMLE